MQERTNNRNRLARNKPLDRKGAQTHLRTALGFGGKREHSFTFLRVHTLYKGKPHNGIWFTFSQPPFLLPPTSSPILSVSCGNGSMEAHRAVLTPCDLLICSLFPSFPLTPTLHSHLKCRPRIEFGLDYYLSLSLKVDVWPPPHTIFCHSAMRL